jgi:hypothetical protein
VRNRNLLEFGAGWPIHEYAALKLGFRGAVMRVVERATSSVARFPCPLGT